MKCGCPVQWVGDEAFVDCKAIDERVLLWESELETGRCFTASHHNAKKRARATGGKGE
jgi:hypothetical protein